MLKLSAKLTLLLVKEKSGKFDFYVIYHPHKATHEGQDRN